MKKVFVIISIVIAVISCNNEKVKNDTKIVFDKEKNVEINIDDAIFYPTDSIALQSEIPVTPIFSYLLSNGEEYLLVDYDRGQILRFSKSGEFLNTIGRRGQGPGEFTNIKDVNIKEGNRVQILGDDGFLEYDLKGTFLTKKENPISSFSFVSDTENNYCFFGMGDFESKKYKMVQTDDMLNVKEKIFPMEKEWFPIEERNFYKFKSNITFRESFNDNLYRIEQGDLVKSYTIDFKELQIPKEYADLSPYVFMEKLMTIDYANVMNYMENADYSLLQIFEYKSGDIAGFYYWIINRKTKEEKIIRLNNIFHEFYMLHPQVLTEDNNLYCLGYRAESDLDKMNATIYILDLELLFKNSK